MTPPCCKKCPHRTRDGRCLSQGTDCPKWREWFHREWTAIQIAAGVIKAPEEPQEETPEEEPQEETPATNKKRPTVCLPR